MHFSVSVVSLLIFCFNSGFLLVGCQNVTNKCINELVRIDCRQRPHCFVHILSAYYGHPPNNRPLEGCAFALGHCITNATDIWSRCSGQRQCEVYVRQARDEVRAVCDRPSEYLTVTYECQCTEPCARLEKTSDLHISYSSDSLEFGTRARFGCSRGLTLTGPAERRCTTQGLWSHVQPVCSVPKTSCGLNDIQEHHTVTITYKSTCLQLHDRSFSWSDARARCNTSNSLLLNTSNDENKIAVVGWWLDNLKVEGYVWTAEELTGRDCIELYKGVSEGGAWGQRTVPCSLRNLYICQYEANEIEKSDTKSKKTDTELAIGLSVGLVVLCICCCTLVYICIWRRRRRKLENNITMITATPSTSSCNLAEQEYIYSNAVSESPTSNNDSCNQTLNCPDSITIESPTYDDVYVPRSQSKPELDNLPIENNKNGNTRLKPPLKRKPRPAGARLYTKHTYENVALHNLTESLKRKFFPRKGSSVRPKDLLRGPKQIKETSLSVISPVPCVTFDLEQCNCNSCPVAPERTVSKHDLSQYCNGKCKFCGKRENASSSCDLGAPVSYSTVVVSAGKRRSSGLRVIDNDLYDGDTLESSA